MQWSPINVLLQLLFGAGVVVGAIGIIIASRRKNQRLAQTLARGLGGWVALYLAAVLVDSLASREIVLAHGERKYFCGFYIDCHLSVAVQSVRRVRTIDTQDGRRTAQGTYYLVTVIVANDARRATLGLHRPGVYVVDDRKRIYPPLPASVLGLPVTSDAEAALSLPLLAGRGYPSVLMFDLPDDAANPRLLVTEGEGRLPDRLFELFLIGDEDSIFHQKTTLRL